MDLLDLRIVMALSQNSRIPYRELGEGLGLSVNAVHKRVQAIVDAGAIRRFTAELSLAALPAVVVNVFGLSQSADTKATMRRLGEDERTARIMLATGNHLYVIGYLRDVSELGPFLDHVRTVGEAPAAQVGIVDVPREYTRGGGEMTRNDYRIVQALETDSRKPTAQVAEELGLTAKTVSRRLARLIDRNLVLLSIIPDPAPADGALTFLHVVTRPGADRQAIGAGFADRYKEQLMGVGTFSNLPDWMYVQVWGNTMGLVREIQDRLRALDGVESVSAYVALEYEEYDTWREAVLHERARRGGPPP